MTPTPCHVDHAREQREGMQRCPRCNRLLLPPTDTSGYGYDGTYYFNLQRPYGS